MDFNGRYSIVLDGTIVYNDTVQLLSPVYHINFYNRGYACKYGKTVIVNFYGATTSNLNVNDTIISGLPNATNETRIATSNEIELVIGTDGTLKCASEVPSGQWFVLELVYFIQ